jgi:predicted ATP-dependent endonuclease of OLD family
MIKHITIEQFWSQYKIDWQPYPDVNILVGINGSGKSTLLRILHTALSCHHNVPANLQKMLADGYALRIEGDNIDISYKSGQTHHTCHNGYKCHFVNTYDEIIKEKKVLTQELSPLAAHLFSIIFNTHETSLNGYRLKATESQEAGLRISERLRQWTAIVNDFFSTTKKTFEIQGSEVFFKQASGDKITLDRLSSGEKRLLIILTYALVQDTDPFIMLMDEPEISLDIDWQYKLIDAIRTFSPHCQLFIATHSPGIFGDSWNDKLIFMEELLQQ